MELETNGGTLICHSFWEADTSNMLCWWMVSTCVRSVDQSAPYFLYCWLLLLWASLLKGKGKTDKQPGEMAEQVQNWDWVSHCYWDAGCHRGQQASVSTDIKRVARFPALRAAVLDSSPPTPTQSPIGEGFSKKPGPLQSSPLLGVMRWGV